MPQMNKGQARVVDPILSNHLKQYTNLEFVLGAIFPTVTIPQRGGRVIKFGKEGFRRYNSRRAPGADTKRIQVGYASQPIALNQDSLEALVPMELQQEAQAVPGIDLASAAVTSIMDSMMLGIEYERAQLATNAATYSTNHKQALSGGDQWSDPTADLKAQVNDTKETVRKKIGHYPNRLTLSPAARESACENEKLQERFKYTSSASVTDDMLAQYFDVDQVIVPKAVSLPEGAPEDAAFEDVWGNFVHLCYVPANVSGIHQPSFGYTYQLEGYPMVEQPYYDERAKSWAYPTTIEEAAYLTGADAAFLFSNVVSG